MIENRHVRVDYLLETVADFRDPRDLLEDIVRAMSDQEFDSIYQYICRMRDIEPDEEKFNESLCAMPCPTTLNDDGYPVKA
jgi:hypothetical protein